MEHDGFGGVSLFPVNNGLGGAVNGFRCGEGKLVEATAAGAYLEVVVAFGGEGGVWGV